MYSEMEKMNKLAISQNIKKQMAVNHMDSIDLANEMKQSQYSTVAKWINGERQPSAYALYRLSKVFGVSMEELMEGIEDD